jgi:hypothetical protein
MRLIRIFYEPWQVFTELRDGRWIPALSACILLSLLSQIIFVNTIGTDVLADRAEMDHFAKRPEISHSALTLVMYATRPIGTAIGLLVTALLLCAVLYAVNGVVHWGVVLAVCSYAAYVREAINCVLTLVAILYFRTLGMPLRNIITDATLFVTRANTSRLMYQILSRLDLLTFGFLALVTIGVWKTNPSLRLQKAVAVVLISWLIYVGLEFVLQP